MFLHQQTEFGADSRSTRRKLALHDQKHFWSGHMRGMFACAIGIALGGCASLPDVSLTYYLARTEVRITVSRVVACNDKDTVFASSIVTPTVRHFADTGQAKQIPLVSLKRAWLADSDFTVSFFEDGRLKTINAISDGQAGPILKAVASLAVTAGTLATRQASTNGEFCQYIRTQGGDKPLTLTYEKVLDLNQLEQPIDGISTSKPQARIVDEKLGGVKAKLEKTKAPASPVVATNPFDGVRLALRQPALREVSVEVGSDAVWAAALPVAHEGTIYEVPIPKAALFGKETFVLKMTESGAVESLQYANASNVAASSDGLTAILAATRGKTTAENADEFKAQVDLILQQQRLIQCQADPKLCK